MRTPDLIAAGATSSPGVQRNPRAAIVAAHELAAAAGAAVLDAGGNAADAAVAVAAALAVVDCANCGIGGFGGFAVLDRGDAGPAMQIGFNARVPRAFDCTATQRGPPPPGALVSPPAVVAGLAALQGGFGRLPAGDAWASAIRLAREGFPVGKDLAAALRWAAQAHAGLNGAFRDLFFRGGEPLRPGERLVQPRLAQTLERVAAHGAAAMGSGPIVESICRTTREAGGCLEPGDFESLDANLCEAASCSYEGAEVSAADPQQGGAGILFAALRSLEGATLAEARGERYVQAVAGALAAAWRERCAAYQAPPSPPAQTTHLCVADRDGMMVSMTFTHGPSWFGSGLLDRETGVLLNTGASIFTRRASDGRIVALPNVTPVIVRRGDARFALGSPGGRHIPAIVLQAIVDLVHYRTSPGRLLGQPRMSADEHGNVDAEAALVAAFPARTRREIPLGEYYGPAGMIAWEGGCATGYTDPRFDGASLHAGAGPIPGAGER